MHTTLDATGFAALRLARAEDATLMPAYLATVPKQLPLDCAIPNEAAKAMSILEAIEQRATPQHVPVWLLQKAPAEVLILRPGPSDEARVSASRA